MPVITVLAGVNGAGKSSIVGELLRAEGFSYWNPDEAATRIREQLQFPIEEANWLVWAEGKRRLEQAIERCENFAIETTLGGATIPRLLAQAPAVGSSSGRQLWRLPISTTGR